LDVIKLYDVISGRKQPQVLLHLFLDLYRDWQTSRWHLVLFISSTCRFASTVLSNSSDQIYKT